MAHPKHKAVRARYHGCCGYCGVWIGGRGSGELTLQIVEDSSGDVIFQTLPRMGRFIGDPTAVGGVVFRIRNCSFPAAGIYWVEVRFADAIIHRQRLLLRSEDPHEF